MGERIERRKPADIPKDPKDSPVFTISLARRSSLRRTSPNSYNLILTYLPFIHTLTFPYPTPIPLGPPAMPSHGNQGRSSELLSTRTRSRHRSRR